jgi:hypothetical protein
MPLTNGRIRHSVVFTLTHAEGFELMREVSPKNDYRFGLTMEFADPSAYTAYNEHPDHVAFVRDRWDAEVTSFLEIDTTALSPGIS